MPGVVKVMKEDEHIPNDQWNGTLIEKFDATLEEFLNGRGIKIVFSELTASKQAVGDRRFGNTKLIGTDDTGIKRRYKGRTYYWFPRV